MYLLSRVCSRVIPFVAHLSTSLYVCNTIAWISNKLYLISTSNFAH